MAEVGVEEARERGDKFCIPLPFSNEVLIKLLECCLLVE